MATLPPLIITACDPMVDPQGGSVERQTEESKRLVVEAIIRESCDARDAGAAISHHHGVSTHAGNQGNVLDWEATNATILGVQRKSDVITQIGGVWATGSDTKEGQQRLDQIWRKAKPEMVSVITNRMEFASMGLGRVATRDSIERSLGFCMEQGVKAEFEVWQIGDTWNLKQVLQKVNARPPFWVELLHAGDGAVWSPATVEETLHRAAYLPEGALWHVNAYTAPKGQLTPEDHTRFLAQIIAIGGHVRIGKEDRPDLATGQPAKSNAELVEHIAWIARKLGREVATPNQARKMLGLK